MRFKVEFTATAADMLLAIKDRRVRDKILERAAQLGDEPDKQGKTLKADLSGFRSVRAVGQRYRILFRIEDEKVVVYVVAVGLRKAGDQRDVYALARKLLRVGLVDKESGE